MLQLGVTRDASKLKELTDAAALRGVRLVPLPVIMVESVSFDWPHDLDINAVDWLVFTSANGVHAFFERLNGLKLQLSSKTKIAAVGEKTSAAISSYEHTSDFIPDAAYGKQLFQQLLDSTSLEGTTVVYARGESVNFDPAPLFDTNKVNYFPLICYRTVTTRVPDATISDFTENDYILFTAPSAVSAFNSQFGRPRARAIAIGKSTAGQMNEFDWNEYIIMDQPDIDKVLEYL